ncbi:hypothetical protein Tco_1360498 [Tanacetum coccineum]
MLWTDLLGIDTPVRRRLAITGERTHNHFEFGMLQYSNMSSATSDVKYSSVYTGTRARVRAFWGVRLWKGYTEEDIPGHRYLDTTALQHTAHYHVDQPLLSSPGYITESDPGGDDGNDGDDDLMAATHWRLTPGYGDEDERIEDDEEEEAHLVGLTLYYSISLPPEAEVERLLAMTTPSPSPPIHDSTLAGERLC